ncbi:MAG: DUF1667 domain-containing protein [Eubacteriales bacterium]|nr:DUF1667 domain-containing protein [Eubacteriales bacterium]
MEQQITCINCPVGCRLQVVVEDGEVKSVTGNSCNRGLTYAKQECTAPMRMVTASVPVMDRQTPVSAKTRTPIPKKDIFHCMAELGKVQLHAPVEAGQVICANVCGTGVDVIATKSVQ